MDYKAQEIQCTLRTDNGDLSATPEPRKRVQLLLFPFHSKLMNTADMLMTFLDEILIFNFQYIAGFY